MSPAPQSGVISMAYHPLESYPAILYEGPTNGGVRIQRKLASGWTEPEIVDAVDPAFTGGRPYRYRSPALAFDSDGAPYISYRGGGDYAVHRLLAFDGSDWQLVHSSSLKLGLPHDATTHPYSGMPLFTFGSEPLRVIELLPTP
jgi:hypothetical protein